MELLVKGAYERSALLLGKEFVQEPYSNRLGSLPGFG